MRHVFELPNSLDLALKDLARQEGMSPRALLADIILSELRRRIIESQQSAQRSPRDESTRHIVQAADRHEDHGQQQDD